MWFGLAVVVVVAWILSSRYLVYRGKHYFYRYDKWTGSTAVKHYSGGWWMADTDFISYEQRDGEERRKQQEEAEALLKLEDEDSRASDTATRKSRWKIVSG